MANMVRWDPFRDLLSMERDVNRLFADLGALPPLPRTERGDYLLTPSVDVVKRGEDLVIRAEMPGINPADIDISVVDDMLTIRGKRTEAHETKDVDYLMRESTYGEFLRTMRLPHSVKPETIHAVTHNGILEVTIPHGAQRTVREAVHVPIETRTSAPKKIKARS
jgi:HSP20 family protein